MRPWLVPTRWEIVKCIGRGVVQTCGVFIGVGASFVLLAALRHKPLPAEARLYWKLCLPAMASIEFVLITWLAARSHYISMHDNVDYGNVDPCLRYVTSSELPTVGWLLEPLRYEGPYTGLEILMASRQNIRRAVDIAKTLPRATVSYDVFIRIFWRLKDEDATLSYFVRRLPIMTELPGPMPQWVFRRCEQGSPTARELIARYLDDPESEARTRHRTSLIEEELIAFTWHPSYVHKCDLL